ncbi:MULTISPECIES: SUKH-4 family immunity protein [unclassified Streptomyces]|uniref:SUKH-4 family immunity protein n=1 Tax=unclassified Streptomyces TaxID=2593676 RepID=UPI0037FB9212
MPHAVDRSVMEAAFGPDVLVTLDEDTVSGVPHAATRAFLVDVGLPDETDKWFELDEGFSEGDVRLGEIYPEVGAHYGNLPEGGLDWISLGAIPYDDIAVDHTTGTVWCLPDGSSEIYPLNKDIHSFAAFLCALERERPNYDLAVAGGIADPEAAAARLAEEFTRLDPTSVDRPEGTWQRVLGYVREAIPE